MHCLNKERESGTACIVERQTGQNFQLLVIPYPPFIGQGFTFGGMLKRTLRVSVIFASFVKKNSPRELP